MFIRVIGGFLMALADSVPGVSGGTIAFLLGIYDEFINSLNNIVSKDKEKRSKAVRFLIKMGSGWIVGMALASLIITEIFETHIYLVSSLFMGFIFVAIPIIINEEKNTLKNKKALGALWFVIGLAIVVAITYMSSNAMVNGIDLRWGEFSLATGIYLFFCAMLAISAMVLPGISGSTIMLVFGVYQAIMLAVKGVVKLDVDYIPALIIFGLGVVAGVLSVVKGLKLALDKCRSQMVYCILGMMIGSFYSIVNGPTTLKENPQPMMSFDTFSIVFFIIGGVIIVGLQLLQYVFNKRENK